MNSTTPSPQGHSRPMSGNRPVADGAGPLSDEDRLRESRQAKTTTATAEGTTTDTSPGYLQAIAPPARAPSQSRQRASSRAGGSESVGVAARVCRQITKAKSEAAT
jgi:hypothetical protein